MEANYSGDPEDKDKDVKFIGWLLLVLLALVLVTQLSGCKQIEYVTVPEYHTDTLIQTNVQRDSIYSHDSIYIKDRGDTVWIERWHTRWRDIYQLDTIYQATHDTIPKPYVMLEYTDKPLSAWQKLRIYIGDIAIFVTLIIMVIFLIKRKLLP